MLCPDCGAEVGDKIALCPNCEAKREAAERVQAAPPIADMPIKEGAAIPTEEPEELLPAEFPWRVGAAASDLALLLIVATAYETVVGRSATGMLSGLSNAQYKLWFLTLLSFLYFPWLEGSPLQGTIGKLLLGLVVMTDDEHPVTLGKAFRRHLCRVGLTILFAPGFLMALVSAKKQSHYDIMSGTVVLASDQMSAPRRFSSAVASVCVFALAITLALRHEPPRADAVALPPVAPVATESMPVPVDPTTVPFKPPTSLADPGAVAEESTATTTTEPPALESVSAQVPRDTELQGFLGYAIAGNTRVLIADAIALYNAESDQLNIGMFHNPVDATTTARMIVQNDLFIDENNPPPVVISMQFTPDAKTCSPDSLSKYEVIFRKGAPLDFPNHGDFRTFERLGGNLTAQTLPEFTCALRDGDEMRTRLDDRAAVDVAEQRFQFLWKFNLRVPIHQVDEEGALEHSGALPQTPREKPDYSFPGTAAAGDMSVRFATVAAFYHRKYNRLEIGFFPQTLTEDELEQIRNQRLLRANKSKPPVVTANITLQSGAPSIARDKIQSYNVYFYRDNGGILYFPGDYDIASFVRDRRAVAKHEIYELTTQDNGSTLRLAVSGRGMRPNSQTEFAWDIHAECPIIELSE